MSGMSTHVAILLTVLLAMQSTLGCLSQPPDRVTIHGIEVVDGVIRQVSSDGVAVRAGRINTHFHPSGCSSLAEVIHNLRDLQKAGTTTVAYHGLPLTLGRAVRHYVGTGRQRGPRFLTSGPTLVPVAQSACEVSVRSVEDARQTVQQFVVDEVDFVSASSTLPRDVLCAAVDEAQRLETSLVVEGDGPCPGDDLRRLQDALGQVAPGYRADLVAQNQVWIDGVSQELEGPWYELLLAYLYWAWDSIMPPTKS